MRKPGALPNLPPETTDAERIAALEDERRLLEPYASTKGLRQLIKRLDEIKAAVHRLKGLHLEPLDDA